MPHETHAPCRSLISDELKRRCIESLQFDDRYSSDSPYNFIGLGQDRFLEALKLGISTQDPTFNIAVSGLSGAVGFEKIKHYIGEYLEKREVSNPDDVCYVFNFDTPHEPLCLLLPKGEAHSFQRKLLKLLEKLHKRVPVALQSAEFHDESMGYQKDFVEFCEEMDMHVREETESRGAVFIGSFVNPESGMKIVPKKEDTAEGESSLMPEKEIERLSPEDREKLDVSRLELAKILSDIMRERRVRSEAYSESMEKLSFDMASEVIENTTNEVFKNIDDLHQHSVLRCFCEGLKEYSLNNYSIFMNQKDSENSSQSMIGDELERNPYLPWHVNICVDNSETEDIPIVATRITSVSDLLGRINRVVVNGVLHTNHTQIRTGALAEANGGFLIVSARDMLTIPFLWETLKRAIKHQEIVIETPASMLGYEVSQLEPYPIPLNLRVVLFGEPQLINLLVRHDSEFTNFFKVHADLLPFVERSDNQVSAFGEWIQRVSDERELHSVTECAQRALIEYAGRFALTRKQSVLSTDFSAVESLLVEADTFVPENEAEAATWHISAEHIHRARKKKIWRSDFWQEHLRESMVNEDILVGLSGNRVGSMNGLYVASRGRDSFGGIMRANASVSMGGKSGVFSIHSGKELSGPFLTKADKTVLTVLKRLYCQEITFAPEVIFSFEQTYNMVEGDSASLAQYFAIISALADVPISQSIAITGSMSIHGDVQLIGGVNEKIEGYFRVCEAAEKLSRKHGVIIPHRNVQDLMLDNDVIEAVEAGMFNIWSIKTLDEGIKTLMGKEPEEVHNLVRSSLQRYFDNKIKLTKRTSFEEVV